MIKQSHLRFTTTWREVALTLMALLIFSALGFWQIHRAQEKQQLLLQQHQFAQQAPFQWHPLLVAPQQYQRVQLHGYFLPIVWLLDNQYFNHRWGYHVISPLRLDIGKIVLVDRGWIAGYPTRDQLPQVTVLHGLAEVRGSTYYPGKQWQFGATFERQTAQQQTVRVIESLQFKDLQQHLRKPIYPFIIRLDVTSIETMSPLIKHWTIVSMPPTRHIAYAIQWFAFAIVSVIIFFGVSMKRDRL